MKKSIGPKTIVYPAPVLIVGTYDAVGKPNLMNVGWGGICCSEPPCVAISIRKSRQTYQNLTAAREFSVNIPSETFIAEADYVGMVSGKNEDKFAKTGLTPVRCEFVNAPYVQEFPLVLECKVLHVFDLGIHTQFVGQILDVKVDEEMLDERGIPDIEKIRPILFAPESWTYHGLGDGLGRAFSAGDQFKK